MGREEERSVLWTELWMPLLQAIADVAVQGKEWETRLYALMVLERLLASRDYEGMLLPPECSAAIERIVLPMVKTLLEKIDISYAGREMSANAVKMRLRGVTLVLKTFLQHHVGLVRTLPEEKFRQLWFLVLEETAGTGRKKDGLAEYLNESLKNIVLVMQSNSILVTGNVELVQGTVEILQRLNPTVLQDTQLIVPEIPKDTQLPTATTLREEGSEDRTTAGIEGEGTKLDVESTIPEQATAQKTTLATESATTPDERIDADTIENVTKLVPHFEQQSIDGGSFEPARDDTSTAATYHEKITVITFSLPLHFIFDDSFCCNRPSR